MVAATHNTEARKGVDASSSNASRTSEPREQITRYFADLSAAAERANPARGDRLEQQAQLLKAAVSRVQSGDATPQETSDVVGQINKLATEVHAEQTRGKNPWSVTVSPAAEGSRGKFHSVVTLSVPNGDVIDLAQRRTRPGGGCEEGKLRLCPGQVAAGRKFSGGEVWREPDPSKPGYDKITVGTYAVHKESTRCGSIEHAEFKGSLTFSNPCVRMSTCVNVNNGLGNEHLKVTEAFKPLAITEAPITTSEERQPAQVREVPSPSDNYRAGGFATFAEYAAAAERESQLPAKYSVALEQEPLKIRLKPGEVFSVHQPPNGAMASFSPSHHAKDLGQAEVKKLLMEGGVFQIERDPKDLSGSTYLLTPGTQFNEREYRCQIRATDKTGSPLIVTETMLYVGPTTDSGARSEAEATPPPVRSEDPGVSQPTTLPVSGTAFSRENPLQLRFGETRLERLSIYKDGHNLGTVSSSSKAGETPIGVGGELLLKRSLTTPGYVLLPGTSVAGSAYVLAVHDVNGGQVARTVVKHDPKKTPVNEPVQKERKESTRAEDSEESW